MNIYAIYVNSKKEQSSLESKKIEVSTSIDSELLNCFEECTVLNTSGKFSLVAAMFNVFWAIYYKMWYVAFALLAVPLILQAFSSSALAATALFMWKLLVFLFFGFFANDLRECKLEKKKYVLKDIIAAGSEEEARLKFATRVVA